MRRWPAERRGPDGSAISPEAMSGGVARAAAFRRSGAVRRRTYLPSRPAATAARPLLPPGPTA